MTGLPHIASLVVATTTFALYAQTRCPGNVESVPLHPVNGYQMIVAVSVNHSGPYNFLLDTGTQFTMIDPSLAARDRIEWRARFTNSSVSRSDAHSDKPTQRNSTSSGALRTLYR